jgi:hypothetical protein
MLEHLLALQEKMEAMIKTSHEHMRASEAEMKARVEANQRSMQTIW